MHAAIRRLFHGLVLVLAIMPCLGQEEPPPAPAAGPWFDEVTRPIPLALPHGTALCRAAWTELRNGRSALGAASTGGAMRAVFLSWSDGSKSANVVFGIGDGPVNALRAALDKIPADRLPGGQLRWVKVDVVQDTFMIPQPALGDGAEDKEAVLAASSYFARENALPLPSLVGIAFSPSSQIAILPDQLLGLGMTDPKNRLVADPYAQWLVEQGRKPELRIWNLISVLSTPQKLCLFETQAWFTDNGRDCVPLYRGHRLYDDATPDELAGIIAATAQRLAGVINEKGRETAPFPEWIGLPNGRIRTFDAALTALALAQAAHYMEDKQGVLAAGDRLAQALVKRLKPMSDGSRSFCLVEQDENEEDEATSNVQAAWRTVRLSTNALCALALCTLAEHGDATRYDAPLGGLARFLLAQRQPGGVFVGQRRWPGGSLTDVVDPTGSALAVCALQALHEKTKLPVFRDAAVEGFEALLPTVAKRPMDGLSQDEWFLRAADRCFTYQWDDRYIQQAQRFALAAVAEQVREPVVPDSFGDVPSRPSATAAATRSGLIAVAARLIHDGGRQDAAREIMLDVRPSVLAQLQGRITAPESMYLAEPTRHLDFFRDHVQGVGFDLQCQYAQLLSLCEVARTMKHLHLDSLRDPQSAASKRIDELLLAARTKATTYPQFLAVFDGKLVRHHIELPERAPDEAAAPDAPAARPAPSRLGRGEPVVRPVAPRR